jgi:hypothetical protein
MLIRKVELFILVFFISVTLAACAGGDAPLMPAATNYSSAAHWLNIPATDKPVDVFYLYPTAWQRGPNDPYICPIDNPSMRAGAPSAFARSATAFESVANIYAPFTAGGCRLCPVAAAAGARRLIAHSTLDAVAAFDYYIRHFNRGRRLFSRHSQTNVLINLLTGY